MRCHLSNLDESVCGCASCSARRASGSSSAHGSAASCQICGERLRGQIWEWGSYETICGLCVDDLMNKDYKRRHDLAMQKQTPPNVRMSDGADK